MEVSAPTPQAPQEDPEIKAERERMRQRAEEDKIRATQAQLKLETQSREQNVGIASLFGSLAGGRRGLTSLLGSG